MDLISDEMSRRIIAAAEQIARTSGAESVTVRSILRALGISNRVFYNRFHNAAEVLDIVYANTVLKIRESLVAKFDPEQDFFQQVLDIVENTLVMSYECKRSSASTSLRATLSPTTTMPGGQRRSSVSLNLVRPGAIFGTWIRTS